MATDSLSSPTNNRPCSNFRSVVMLKEWWLIKTEKEFDGKRLAVAGFTWENQQSTKLFSSQPIIRIYDMFTLETADGMNITIRGLINRSRAHDSGISSQVCNHFLLGFPFNWEDIAYRFMGEESNAPMFTTRSHGLSNARDNLKDGNSEGNFYKEKTVGSSAETSKDSVPPVNVDSVGPSDVELNATEDVSNEHEDGGAVPILNTLTRNRMGYATGILEANKSKSSEEDFAVKRAKSSVTMDTSGSISRRMRTLKTVEELSNKINTILSPKSTGPNSCSSVPKDQANDIAIHVGGRLYDANISTPSNLDVESAMNKQLESSKRKIEKKDKTESTLKSKRLRNLRSCKENDDSLKDVSPLAHSSMTNVTPSMVHTAVDTSNDRCVPLSKKLESPNNNWKENETEKFNSTGTEINSLSSSVSKENKAIVRSNDEETLAYGESKSLPFVDSEIDKDLPVVSDFASFPQRKMDKLNKMEISCYVRRSNRLKKAS